MKLSTLSTALLLSLTALLSVHADQETPDANKDTNRRNMKGINEREANARTALNQAASEIMTNPDGLFKRLDHDENGTLSKEEFGRIVNIGVQGAAAIEGTKGVTSSGAAGATGVTGTSSVGGQATMLGQAPATYGQQAGITGQQPAPGQAPTNTPRDAAAAGQQQAVPANPPSAPAQNPKPAAGQQPTPNSTPTAPLTKDPQ